MKKRGVNITMDKEINTDKIIKKILFNRPVEHNWDMNKFDIDEVTEKYCDKIKCSYRNGGGNESDPMAYVCYGCEERELYGQIMFKIHQLKQYVKCMKNRGVQFIDDINNKDNYTIDK